MNESDKGKERLLELARFINSLVYFKTVGESAPKPLPKPSWFKTKRPWTTLTLDEQIREAVSELSYRISRDQIASTALSSIMRCRVTHKGPIMQGPSRIMVDRYWFTGPEGGYPVSFMVHRAVRAPDMKLIDLRNLLREAYLLPKQQ